MKRPRSFAVALTGGIASGKSAVERRFAALGASIVDSDLVARELVGSGSTALELIVAEFGTKILDAQGELDRAAMRDQVFGNSQARKRLEAILHPLIRSALFERSEAVDGEYCLLVIPLLVESGDYAWVDRVLLVDVPRDVQIERLIARDGISPALADSMLVAQASREARRAIADDIIDNSGPPAALDAQIVPLHECYMALARRKRVS